MLKYSVQSRLLAILWVTKTIHKEEPMYAVLDKVTINLKYCHIFRRQNADLKLKVVLLR